MTSHIIRRLLTAIPVMAFVALFIFGLLYLAPGDPAAIMAGDSATVQQIDQIRDALGLDKPFLVRFGEWCAGAIQGLKSARLVAKGQTKKTEIGRNFHQSRIGIDPFVLIFSGVGRHAKIECRGNEQPPRDQKHS